MSANAQTDKLVSDLKRVVHDSEELLHDSAAVAGNGVHELREKLAQAVETAKSTYNKLEEKTKAGAKATDRAIRTHPYQAVGIALGLGLLLGLIAGRRSAAK